MFPPPLTVLRAQRADSFITPVEGPFRHLWIVGDRTSYAAQARMDLAVGKSPYPRKREVALGPMEALLLPCVAFGIAGPIFVFVHGRRLLPQVMLSARLAWTLTALPPPVIGVVLYFAAYRRPRLNPGEEMAHWDRPPAIQAAAADDAEGRRPVAVWCYVMNKILISILPAVLLISGCGSTAGLPMENLVHQQITATPTAFTTRLPGSAPEQQAISIAQAVYSATREENAVGAIILVRHDAAEAYTAMHRITHMPVNAPLLYLDGSGRLSRSTLDEMKRLEPDGIVQDGKTQVYVTGNYNRDVAGQVKRDLGCSVRELHAENPIHLAELFGSLAGGSQIRSSRRSCDVRHRPPRERARPRCDGLQRSHGARVRLGLPGLCP